MFVRAVLSLLLLGTAAAQDGVVAVYPDHLAGRRMASGEVYRPAELVAAHRTLPFGTRLWVSDGRRAVIVTVRDRGPYDGEVDLLVSREAGRRLGIGEGPVRLTIRPADAGDPSTGVPELPGGPPAPSDDGPSDVGPWTVQLGSFSSRAGADRVAARFVGARVIESPGPSWRVWFGHFEDRETAEAWRLRIRGWGADGFVRRIEPEHAP